MKKMKQCYTLAVADIPRAACPSGAHKKPPTPRQMVRGQSDKKIVKSKQRLQVADGADYFFMRVTYKRIMPPTK